jgi:hypothetical protein
MATITNKRPRKEITTTVAFGHEDTHKKNIAQARDIVHSTPSQPLYHPSQFATTCGEYALRCVLSRLTRYKSK